jgi:hypothetical protein
VGLSWTGLSSLALLQDNVTATINGSITTIDLRVNGTKSAVINLADGAIPGDYRSNPRTLDAGLWDGERQIDAGGSLDVCVWFRLGTTGATYTDGISAFSMLNAFNAFYP